MITTTKITNLTFITLLPLLILLNIGCGPKEEPLEVKILNKEIRTSNYSSKDYLILTLSIKNNTSSILPSTPEYKLKTCDNKQIKPETMTGRILDINERSCTSIVFSPLPGKETTCYLVFDAECFQGLSFSYEYFSDS